MLDLLRCLSADWTKTKRTAVRKIVILAPILYSIFILWYHSSKKITEGLNLEIYNSFFNLMAAIIPMGIALFTVFLCMQEEDSGSFNGILSSTISKSKCFNSKLIMVTLLIFIDVFMSTGILLWGMKFVLHIENIQYPVFLYGAILIMIGCLSLCVLYLFLSFAYGMGVSLSIGAVGILIETILGSTVMGDKVWQFLPWTLSARLSQLPQIYLRGFHSNINISQFYYDNLTKGFLSSILFFIILWIVSLIWFNMWEGRKSYES